MRIPGLFWSMLIAVVAACGGSTGGGQQQDPATLIQGACNNAVGLHCSNSPTQQQCTNSLNQARAQAEAQGCISQFDAAMVCFTDKITDCSQDSSVVCSAQPQALDACEGKTANSQCSGGVSSAPPGAPSYYQKCSISCSTWSAQCETKTSPTLECSCTTGPKAGTTFTAPSCKDLSEAFAGQYCQ